MERQGERKKTCLAFVFGVFCQFRFGPVSRVVKYSLYSTTSRCRDGRNSLQ